MNIWSQISPGLKRLFINWFTFIVFYYIIYRDIGQLNNTMVDCGVKYVLQRVIKLHLY